MEDKGFGRNLPKAQVVEIFCLKKARTWSKSGLRG